MTLIKIMKRKDAASVLVAVLLAMILSTMLMWVTAEPAGKISGFHSNGQNLTVGPTGDWRMTYLQPVVSAILQILLLEVLARIYIFAHSALRKKR